MRELREGRYIRRRLGAAVRLHRSPSMHFQQQHFWIEWPSRGDQTPRLGSSLVMDQGAPVKISMKRHAVEGACCVAEWDEFYVRPQLLVHLLSS